MEEVEGDEGVFELSEGHALLDGVGPEADEGGGADLEGAVQLGGGIGAVIPQVRVGVSGAEWAGIFVGDVDEAGLLRVRKDFVEGSGIFDGLAVVVKLAIAVVDGDLIPDADAGGVGMSEVGLTRSHEFSNRSVGAQGDPRVRVIHNGDGLIEWVGEAAGGEVVGEAQGVAGFVGGKLADALENHLQRGIVGRIGCGFIFFVGREKGLGDEVILAATEAAEGHIALDDFPVARIDDGCAVAPSTGVAIDPLDDVVADIHGIGALREEVDAECAGGPAGGLESLIPPARSFDEGVSDDGAARRDRHSTGGE